jgi:6-phosphogluconolactonase (cycloisomerase 2 family)
VAANTFILGYKVNEDGSLTSMGQFNNGITSSLVTIHPSGQFLYSISSSNSIIQFYRINSDGSLTYVTQYTPAAITATSCALKVNPSGSRLYVTAINGTTSYIISYNVLSDGQLSDEKQSTRTSETAWVGKSIYINNNGSYLYSTGGALSTYIIDFVLNSDGTATFKKLTNSTNSTDIVVNQSETFLYSSETQAGKGIMMCGIFSDYSLYSIGSTPVLAASPGFMALHPDGRSLYQADFSNKFVIVYNMNPGGNLTYNGIACTFNNTNEYSIDVKICAKTIYGANK